MSQLLSWNTLCRLALLLACLGAGDLKAQSVSAQPAPIITTLSGVTLSGPGAVAFDAAGDLFIADTKNDVIREVSVGGAVSIVAGTSGTACAAPTATPACGDSGLATAATLNGPNGVAVDAAGDIFIADTGDQRVRKVTPNGIINTVAGTGAAGNFTATGPATTIPLSGPNSIGLDSAGNLYIADSTVNRIVEVEAANQNMYALAGGNGTTDKGDGGASSAAGFAGPRSLTADAAGDVYLVDKTNDVVRMIAANSTPGNGIINTVAGTKGVAGNTGDGGPATSATLSAPIGDYVDAAGNLYIANSGADAIRVVLANGTIYTVAGNGTAGYTGDNGAAVSAEINSPEGIALSPDGRRLAIADTTNNVVRIVALDSTFPGTSVAATSVAQSVNFESYSAGTASGVALTAGLPADFALSTSTNCSGAMAVYTVCASNLTFTPTAPGIRNSQLVLADAGNNKYIFGIAGIGNAPAAALAPGTIKTYAGTGTAGATGDGATATSATLNAPAAAVLDPARNLYIADTQNNKIRFVNAGSGNITTFAGTGTAGAAGDGASATTAELNAPHGLALDSAGNLYVADTGNDTVRKISAQTGNISTIAGTAGSSGSIGDGGLATAALLNAPAGIGLDFSGNLYIADTGDNRIREITPLGIISTVAGTGTAGATGNGGAATSATLNHPGSVAADTSGNLYIADTANNMIRKISAGIITTIAGTGSAGYRGDGAAATAAQLNAPTRVAVDAAGDVYIADSGNNVARVISASTGIITTLVGTGTAGYTGDNGLANAATMNAPAGIALDSADDIYIADTGNNRIARVDDANVTFAYGSIKNLTTTAPQTLTLTNFGNQSLQLSALTFSSAVYAQSATGPSDCSKTTLLAPGGSCVIAVAFTPTANGPYPATLKITDNALNSLTSTQTLTLTGTGITVGTPVSIAASGGNNQTAPPLGNFIATLQALVTDNSSNPVPNVSVTFAAPSTGASGTFSNGLTTYTITTGANGIATATLTAGATRGNVSITATAAGVSIPAVFSETIAGNVAPTLAESISPSGTVTYGQSETLSVTLTPSSLAGTNASGTVTFLDAGVSVGTGAVSNGTANFTYIPIPGTHSYTASYGGDSNFSTSSTSTSTSLVVNKAALTASTTSQTLPYGTPLAIGGTLTGVIAQDAGNVSVSFATSPANVAPPVGVYPLSGTLTGSAAPYYTLTVTGTPTLTIVAAATQTALSTSNATPSPGASVTLTATVSSTVAGSVGIAPAGTVTFFANGVNIGTGLANGSGVATLATSTLPTGVDSITASFATSTGDYTSSAASALSVNVLAPDFTFTLSPSTISIAQGGRGQVGITVAPNATFASTVTFQCAGLAQYASCTFTPPLLTPTQAANSGNGLLVIAAAGPVLTSSIRLSRILSALLLPVMCCAFTFKRRRTLAPGLFAICAAIGLCIGLTGCGDGISTYDTAPTTATITVTAVSATGTVHTATVNLTVVPAS